MEIKLIQKRNKAYTYTKKPYWKMFVVVYLTRMNNLCQYISWACAKLKRTNTAASRYSSVQCLLIKMCEDTNKFAYNTVQLREFKLPSNRFGYYARRQIQFVKAGHVYGMYRYINSMLVTFVACLYWRLNALS